MCRFNLPSRLTSPYFIIYALFMKKTVEQSFTQILKYIFEKVDTFCFIDAVSSFVQYYMWDRRANFFMAIFKQLLLCWKLDKIHSWIWHWIDWIFNLCQILQTFAFLESFVIMLWAATLVLCVYIKFQRKITEKMKNKTMLEEV